MAIPLVELKAQYQDIRTEIDAAIDAVVAETAFVRGKYVDAFERAFAQVIGAKHCISCGSGTDALFISLRMLGIGPGHEVITTANSWIATSETISLTGATPVFADVETEHYCLDPAAVAAKIGPRTRAILPVHLFGQPAQMDELTQLAREHDLLLVEDCAQAHLASFQGTTVGLFGAAGTFSFYPSKNLGAYGDAGAIVTDDDDLAMRVRMFANHGARPGDKLDHQFEGMCSRMDGLQAAVLAAKLPHLRAWTSARRVAAARYGEMLASIPDVTVPAVRPDAEHVYHVYCIRTPHRDRVQQALRERDISTAIHYPTPLPLLTAYERLGYAPKDFPVAMHHAQTVISLPIYPEITSVQQRQVVDAIVAGLRKA